MWIPGGWNLCKLVSYEKIMKLIFWNFFANYVKCHWMHHALDYINWVWQKTNKNKNNEKKWIGKQWKNETITDYCRLLLLAIKGLIGSMQYDGYSYLHPHHLEKMSIEYPVEQSHCHDSEKSRNKAENVYNQLNS